jgi:hypothetical protein
MKFTIAWIVWLLWFVYWEVRALRRKTLGDTLSEHAWKTLKLTPVLWFTLLGGFIWLGIHFFLRTLPRRI